MRTCIIIIIVLIIACMVIFFAANLKMVDAVEDARHACLIERFEYIRFPFRDWQTGMNESSSTIRIPQD